MALQLTDSNFTKEVLESQQLCVVDFWAAWCGPCVAIAPVIEDLSKEFAGKAVIGKVDVDNNPTVSSMFGITSIPAILFFKNGKIVDKMIGAHPKASFVNKINSLL